MALVAKNVRVSEAEATPSQNSSSGGRFLSWGGYHEMGPPPAAKLKWWMAPQNPANGRPGPAKNKEIGRSLTAVGRWTCTEMGMCEPSGTGEYEWGGRMCGSSRIGGLGWVGLDSSGFSATDAGWCGSSGSGASINEVT